MENLVLTISTQQDLEREIAGFLRQPAERRELRIVPMRGPINFDPYETGLIQDCLYNPGGCREIYTFDRVTVAGGSEPVHPLWVRDVRDACGAASVEFEFFGWGDWLPVDHIAEEQWRKFYRSNRKAGPREDQVILDDIYGRRCLLETIQLQYDGREGAECTSGHASMLMYRVGSSRSGRILDGRTHDGTHDHNTAST